MEFLRIKDNANGAIPMKKSACEIESARDKIHLSININQISK